MAARLPSWPALMAAAYQLASSNYNEIVLSRHRSYAGGTQYVT